MEVEKIHTAERFFLSGAGDGVKYCLRESDNVSAFVKSNITFLGDKTQ